jgi:hypothetical protein
MAADGAPRPGPDPSVAGCVAVWNAAANAEVRRATAPPDGPSGAFAAVEGDPAGLRRGAPYEVYVGILVASGGRTMPDPPRGCAVFFRFPGDASTPPRMLAVACGPDEAAYDLERARVYHGIADTAVTQLPRATHCPDGTLALPPPAPL